MTEWQPIETAPKDGTRIIALEDDEVFVADYYRADGDEGWWDSFNHFPAQPTHWITLPALPQGTK